MDFYSKTDIGKKRYSNQDAVAGKVFSNNLAFTAVCDGMGGANGGDIASNMAIAKISENMSNINAENISEEQIIKIMNDSIQKANTEIFKKSIEDELLHGMGTTVVLAVVKGNVLYVMHAGDSRAYIINSNGIFQISVDHSVVQQMVDSGKITLKEAKNHFQKNIITRALGIEKNVKLDYNNLILKNGDILLLCTDGLSNHLEDNEIYQIFKKNDLNKVPDILINKCNSRGGKDNITVSILKYEN